MARPAAHTAVLSGQGPTEGPLTAEELQLAARNRGMPLEALRYDVTPVGLHYLLVHFDIPEIDESSWRLDIAGNVEHPRPISQPWLVEAVGTAEWTGTPLRDALLEAGVRPDSAEIVFTGADHGVQGEVEHDYERSLSLDAALRPEVLLAYEMNGRPLEPQHGAPLRLLVPEWYGMTSVKWLTRITVVTERFEGYQQAVAYRYQKDETDPGEGVSRIRVRALMIPPGYPDFLTRRRVVEPGTVTVRGRAWSGNGDVVRVEFGVGETWTDADLQEPVGPFAWREWTTRWDAAPGEHILSCRATDAAGYAQPVEQPWNYQGMGNNLVQTVPVTVGRS